MIRNCFEGYWFLHNVLYGLTKGFLVNSPRKTIDHKPFKRFRFTRTFIGWLALVILYLVLLRPFLVYKGIFVPIWQYAWRCLCLYFWSPCLDNLLIIRWWCSKPRAEDIQTLDSGLIFSTMYDCPIDGFGPPSLPPPKIPPPVLRVYSHFACACIPLSPPLASSVPCDA